MPPFLLDQDQVEIVAPARFVKKKDIDLAIKIINSFGLKVVYDKNLFDQKNIFSGTRKQRIKNVQSALDNHETKAIFFARGGYGSIQIIDSINFENFSNHPKWLIGFSDITTILIHVFQQYGIQSIHGPMPFNFQNTDDISLAQMFNLLKGVRGNIKFSYHKLNNRGVASGKIIGGNLSILCALIGSKSFIKPNQDYILFIEDVDEYIYRIERMIYTLDRSGILNKIKGLIIGDISNSLDNKLPFGKTPYEAINEIVKKYKYPICFKAPIGHETRNSSILIGAKVKLDVSSNFSSIQYLNGR